MEDEFFLKEIGKNIARIRKASNLTQVEFAKKSGIHRSVISRIEQGSENCSIKMLRNIARNLNVSLVELINVESIND